MWIICRLDQLGKLEQTELIDQLTMIIVDQDYDHPNNFHRLIEEVNNHLPPVVINPKEDVAVLQYTGGTTGKPKGAMIIHFNFVSYAYHYRLFYSLQQKGEIILGTSPLFHASGLLMLNLTALTTATYVVVERFNVDTVFEIIRSSRPTLFPGVPTMFIGLINNASALLHPPEAWANRMLVTQALPIKQRRV